MKKIGGNLSYISVMSIMNLNVFAFFMQTVNISSGNCKHRGMMNLKLSMNAITKLYTNKAVLLINESLVTKWYS